VAAKDSDTQRSSVADERSHSSDSSNSNNNNNVDTAGVEAEAVARQTDSEELTEAEGTEAATTVHASTAARLDT
jgi:hypothetical protein